MMYNALKGALEAIWWVLKQNGAIRKWSRAVQVSQRGYEDSEDIYQQTILKISESIPKTELAGKVRSLVDAGKLEDAVRLFLGYSFGVFWRVAQKRSESAVREPVRVSELDGRQLEASEAWELMPTTETEREELRQLLLAAIAQLPEREQYAIVGRFWAEMTTEELGILMGCSPQEVRSYQSRAIQKLRRLLSPRWA